MKNLLALVCLIVSLTLSAGQYLLPIGSSVDKRPARVQLAIGGYGVWAEDDFAYTPAMGDLVTVIRNRLWKLAEGFVPAAGYEEAKAEVLVTPGPFGGKVFKLQQAPNGRWVVPTEALEVELEYGNVAVWATGVTGVEMEVRGNGRTQLFSTIRGTGGTVCRIANTLGGTYVSLSREYTVPKYRESWWTDGEVTLWEGERWVRFTMEGEFIDSSPEPPAFLSQLVAPPLPPRITSIQWTEGIATITVAVADGTPIVLEFSEDFKNWRSAEPQVAKASAGSRILSHRATSAPCGFYRVVVVVPKGATLK